MTMYKPITKFWIVDRINGEMTARIWCSRCDIRVKRRPGISSDEVGCRCATDSGALALAAAGYTADFIGWIMDDEIAEAVSGPALDPIPALPEGRMISFDED
jgi:hypothetical protein